MNEAARLKEFLTAILDHGSTMWPDTSCGTGGIGGQALTTEYHGEVINHLVMMALMGETLSNAADQWAMYAPGTTRLDAKPKTPRRRGPDGRPI